MPKTFTNDLIAGYPSLIEGPLTVVDPSDVSNWIRVEPANARISAAGDARPVRTMLSAYARAYLGPTTQVIGSSIPARSVNSGTVGGFYVNAIRIPDEMDVLEPCRVYVLVAPVADATTNGQVVRIELNWTQVTQEATGSSDKVLYDWDVPDDWTTSEPMMVMIDNGNGHTFDASTFGAGDILGLRLARSGVATEDTFNKAVSFAETIRFEYGAARY